MPPSGCTYNATTTCPIKATFTGTASLQDVTNPQSPISVPNGGNATVQLDMIDYGEPGSSGTPPGGAGPDMFAITVWNSLSQVWYSSRWNGAATDLQLLDGGNVVAH